MPVTWWRREAPVSGALVVVGGALVCIPVLLGMVVLCLLGHAIFKLTYLSNHDYKPLYFESDAATVNEIVLKVSLIRFILRQNIYTTLIGWRIL